MKRHIIKIVTPVVFFILVLVLPGCRKFVEADPPISMLLSNNVYKSDATAAAVMTGVYSRMMANTTGISGGNLSLSELMGMATDELKNYRQESPYSDFYTNNFSPANSIFWPELYQQIFVCNTLLQGINDPGSVITPAIKDQLTGEAKFMRAFLYFYGVNLFGDIPIVIGTDYRVNNAVVRNDESEVYQLIISDLKEAQSLLGENWVSPVGQPTTERVRPNKYAATAMLARVYLYLKDWANAEAQASAVIGNTAFKIETDLSKTFLKASNEAVWQMQPVINARNTNDAYYFVLNAAPGIGNAAAISKPLLDAMDTTIDKRYKNWVNKFTTGGVTYFYPFKYKLPGGPMGAEYLIVLRLPEQYFIRAEARAQQGKITGANSAASDLNVIRLRSGLPATTATTKDDMLAAILAERRIEFFTEWGHRWFDLKRTGTIDAVMTAAAVVKGSTWKTTSKLLSIPTGEIILNPNLTQNEGY